MTSTDKSVAEISKPIELTHATWTHPSGEPVKVFVYPRLVFTVFHAPNQKATMVVSTGGGNVPVLETEEDVITLINEESTASQVEALNQEDTSVKNK